MQNNLHFIAQEFKRAAVRKRFLSSEVYALKMSKCLPNYVLAVFDAYLCSFYLAEPNTSSSLFSAWLPVCLSPSFLPLAALGIVLTSGCATSRHCQQQELPGVRIHCCDSDLCNSASSRQAGTLHYISALFSVLMLKMWLWYEEEEEEVRNTHWTMGDAFCISISSYIQLTQNGVAGEHLVYIQIHNSICKYLEKKLKNTVNNLSLNQ